MREALPVNDELQVRLQSSLGVSYTLEGELSGGAMARVFLAEEGALAPLRPRTITLR